MACLGTDRVAARGLGMRERARRAWNFSTSDDASVTTWPTETEWSEPRERRRAFAMICVTRAALMRMPKRQAMKKWKWCRNQAHKPHPTTQPA